MNPNLIKISDIVEIASKNYLLFEYCNGGDLESFSMNYKKKSGTNFNEKTVQYILKQVLNGLSCLHRNKIIHHDIKPANILLKFKNKNDMFNILDSEIKISDFGLSRFLGNEKLATEICGSPSYASPEVVSHKPYGKETDIWATGVLLYYLVTGDLPWTSRDRMYEQIMSVPSYVSHSCENLITKLMTVNPKDRITIDEALNHNFFFCMQQSFSADHRVFHLTLKTVDEFFYGKDAPLQYKIKKAFKEWSPSDFCQLAKLLHSDIPAKETEIIKLEMLPRPKSKTRLLPKTTKKVARSPSTTAKLIPTGRPNSAKKSSKLSTKGSPKPVSARLFNESAYIM